MGAAPTTVGNRMLALSRLDRFSTAPEVAEGWWSGTRTDAGRIYMCNFRDPRSAVTEVDSIEYIAELAAEIAHKSGDVGSHARWEGRLSGRRG
jgi:hypothetical protein